MTSRAPLLVICLAALAGLGTLLVCAPEYLMLRGFPLDDAWIHAVYGRAVAHAGSLSYNPGIPATGATSPLWAAVLALPHLLTTDGRAIVLLTKLLGFALHLLSALLLFAALADGRPRAAGPLVAAALVAFHPDLVSASVSGMEIPLATLCACAILYTARVARPVPYAAVCAIAPLARPELAALGLVMPLLLFARRAPSQAVPLLQGALLGITVSFGLVALRNVAASGLPLPATFYAKVGSGGLPVPWVQFVGFSKLLGQIAITDSSVLLTVTVGVAGLIVWSRDAEPTPAAAAAALIAGLVFCALSFALVPPIDFETFYQQRYVLPVIPLMVAAVPLLATEAACRWLSPSTGRVACGALLLLLGSSLLIEAPARYQRLANDARNIDDVQVAIGKTLAAAPANDVVWATDAGAIRYFGNAFVVDLMGLNNAQMLGTDAQAFLDAHPPRYFEIVPTWADLDDNTSRHLEAMLFKTSTEYTVTSVTEMQNQWLVRCRPEASPGRLAVRARSFRFACAP